MTFRLKRSTIPLTQLQPCKSGPCQKSCAWDFVTASLPPVAALAMTSAPPCVRGPAPDPATAPLDNSMVNHDPGTLDISGKVQISVHGTGQRAALPRFTFTTATP